MVDRSTGSKEPTSKDGARDPADTESMQREGWVLSLSSWRDEKSVVRWRTARSHLRDCLDESDGRNGRTA